MLWGATMASSMQPIKCVPLPLTNHNTLTLVGLELWEWLSILKATTSNHHIPKEVADNMAELQWYSFSSQTCLQWGKACTSNGRYTTYLHDPEGEYSHVVDGFDTSCSNGEQVRGEGWGEERSGVEDHREEGEHTATVGYLERREEEWTDSI